jgi:flagellar basal-body rod protein FlgC
MVASIQNNLSTLQAFSRQMAVSANNVANALSNDFKKSRAILTEGENGQVKTTITKIDPSGLAQIDPASETGQLKEGSNTDIAEELTYQMTIQQGFSANTTVLKTYEEIIGSLVDLIG